MDAARELNDAGKPDKTPDETDGCRRALGNSNMSTKQQQRSSRREQGEMECRCIIVTKFSLLGYILGALLSFVDVATDILTAVTYFRNDHYIWFSFGLAFALLPSWLMMAAYCVQSYQRGSCSVLAKGLVFFANPFGSGLLKLKLAIVCHRNRGAVWSRNGHMPTDEGFCQDYRSEKVYQYVEGVLENMPQMILQVYAASVQTESITLLQYISVSISYVNLVCILAMFEHNSFPGNHKNWRHLVVVFAYNLFLVAARALALVSFLIAFKWYTTAFLVGHEIVCFATYIYKNHRYFTEKHVWLVALVFMPCYSFVYLGFKVKELYPRTFEIKLGRSLLSTFTYYFFFTSENLVMVFLYFNWSDTSDWYSTALTVTTATLSLAGAVTNLLFTYMTFYRPQQGVRVQPCTCQ